MTLRPTCGASLKGRKVTPTVPPGPTYRATGRGRTVLNSVRQGIISRPPASEVVLVAGEVGVEESHHASLPKNLAGSGLVNSDEIEEVYRNAEYSKSAVSRILAVPIGKGEGLSVAGDHTLEQNEWSRRRGTDDACTSLM